LSHAAAAAGSTRCLIFTQSPVVNKTQIWLKEKLAEQSTPAATVAATLLPPVLLFCYFVVSVISAHDWHFCFFRLISFNWRAHQFIYLL